MSIGGINPADTLFAESPAIDNRLISAQTFVGSQYLITNVYYIKTNKIFSKTLEDVIHRK